MTTCSRLQLVLPQTLARIRAGELATAPLLKSWLQRGERQLLWRDDDLHHARLDPWQHALLHALPSSVRDHGLASAALQWFGLHGQWVTGTRLHVEPVYLQAGLDDLRLVFPSPLTDAERAALFASLQPLMSLAGFELHTGTDQRWSLWSARQFKWLTYSPRSGFATRLRDIMPTGEGAPELRRLMTEVQMLLHDHPVNAQRARRGEAPINALWFWGDAPQELVSERLPCSVFGEHVYLQGLCEHLHQACWPLPQSLDAVLDRDSALLLAPDMSLLELEQRFIQPFDAALRQGRIKQLDVYVDHWRISLRGGWWASTRRRFITPAEVETLT